MLSTSDPSKNYTELTLQTRRNLQKLEEKGTWVCGHAEIQETDLADKHAKIAATEASFLPLNQVPSHCLKPKQLIRSVHYTCGKNHGLTTTQAVTFMIFSQWFQGKLTEAWMEGKRNLIDSK